MFCLNFPIVSYNNSKILIHGSRDTGGSQFYCMQMIENKAIVKLIEWNGRPINRLSVSNFQIKVKLNWLYNWKANNQMIRTIMKRDNCLQTPKMLMVHCSSCGGDFMAYGYENILEHCKALMLLWQDKLQLHSSFDATV